MNVKRQAWILAGTIGVLLTIASFTVDGQGAGQQKNLAKATFGGGCFWCMEHPFDSLPGVVSTTSGYMGGRTKKPTYEQVSSGTTGHREVVQVVYDPSKITYARLVEVFWPNIDPLDNGGQFCDRGSQYRAAVFYHDENQKREAEQSKQAAAKKLRVKGTIVADILPATEFYAAEGYHQDYYVKNSVRYKFYRYGCGRDTRLNELWGAAAEKRSN